MSNETTICQPDLSGVRCTAWTGYVYGSRLLYVALPVPVNGGTLSKMPSQFRVDSSRQSSTHRGGTPVWVLPAMLMSQSQLTGFSMP